MPIPDRKAEGTLPLIEQLPSLVGRAIREKIDYLKEEFGYSSDFGIMGVVAGSRDDLMHADRLSVWVVSTSDGYDTDFVEILRRMTGDRVSHAGTIVIDSKRQRFTERDWEQYCIQEDIEHWQPHRIILPQQKNLPPSIGVSSNLGSI